MIDARTAGEVFFDRLAEGLLAGTDHEVIVAMEDGSAGRRGLATDVIEAVCSGRGADGFGIAYTCGPEIMMAKTVAVASSRRLPVEASVKRVMKCGVGMCGSCCMGAELVCTDGSVFDGERAARHIQQELDGGRPPAGVHLQVDGRAAEGHPLPAGAGPDARRAGRHRLAAARDRPGRRAYRHRVEGQRAGSPHLLGLGG